MARPDETFGITNLTRGSLPRLPFCRMKDTVLGKNYTLSLVFVGDTRSRNLNKEHRDKNKPTDILSFTLTDSEGEIFINLKRARMNAKKHGATELKFLKRLFIHGLLHLKGMDHGSTMDSEEAKFLKRF